MSRSGSKFVDSGPSVSARTLRLFTVSAGDDAGDDVQEAKNPRWLAAREREARAEALRDKIARLLDDIEAEESKDRPAMKKAWLREKKLELRRLSLKPAEGVLAGEATFRKTRKKLRDAKRSQEEDVGKERDVSSNDEAADAALDGDDDDASCVFNLSPSGRLARPNPRAGAATENVGEVKSKKALKNAGKVARFPLETGYKLGRLIRKRREKRKSAIDDADGEASSIGGDLDEAEENNWGRRVATPESRDRQGRRELSLSSDEGNRAAGGPAIRVVVVNDSDGDDASAGCVAGSSRRGSVIADIPELQESVGKKLRDRLAIRKPRSRGKKSSSGSSDDGDGSGRDKKQKKKAKKKAKKNCKTEGDLAENVRRISRASSNVSGPVEFVALEDAEID